MGAVAVTRRFGEVLKDLDTYEWRDWVYIDAQKRAGIETPCVVLNPDKEPIGNDGSTPVAAEQLGLEEYLSIQDLRAIRDNLLERVPSATTAQLCEAADFFFENDAYAR